LIMCYSLDMSEPFQFHWKFRELLEREGVTVYALSQKLGNKVSRPTLYRWNVEGPNRPDLVALGWTLWGLKQLTGKSFQVSDLLEYGVKDDLDTETKAWLESDLSRLGEFEPYDWGDEDPETLGSPVEYVSGKGLLVLKEGK